MSKSEYLKNAFDAFNDGKVSVEAYDAMLLNADDFCEDEEKPDPSENK